MKKATLIIGMALMISASTVNAETYHNETRDGFFTREETITVEDSLTEEMLEETYKDESHWWDFLGKIFHKEETITVW